MKRKIFGILAVALGMFGLTSCDSYFDDVPNNATSLEDVFSNRGQTLDWLTNVYSYIPDETNLRYQSRTNGCWPVATIEGYLPWDHVVARDIIHGTLYPSTGYVNTLWTEYYRGIQYANIYLANVDNCAAMPANEKEWTKAECRALRAFFYYNLMKVFGPVPIVGDQIYKVDDPLTDMIIPRSSVDECFDYIISEMKAAISSGNLASQFTSDGGYETQMKGNFTKEVVEGILSEVYLFRASYVFNGDPFYKDLANNDGKKLFPQEKDMKKWEDARDAAKKIIDSGLYQLCLRDNSGKLVTDVTKADPYNSLFYSSIGRSDNEELIFGRTSSNNDTYPMVPRFSSLGSNYDKGAGAYSVPLEFIDLYLTKNGLRIEDDPDYYTYDVNDPQDLPARNPAAMVKTTSYKDQFSSHVYFTPTSGHAVMKQFYDREPRFYVAITFQNRPWDFDKSAPVEMQFNGNSGPDGNTHDYPIFGTISRKLYYSKESGVDMSCVIRLGEVYLNYAEACCELGELQEAMKYVNLIRSRAGIPEYKESADQSTLDARKKTRIELPAYDQATIRKVIYRERCLELAYESKRYFDVRRWGVGEGKDPFTGAEMTDGWIYPSYHKGGEGGNMTGFNVNNNGATDENKNVNFYKREVQEHRIYSKRMTFFPIPQNEVNRNDEIVQNTGWESAEAED